MTKNVSEMSAMELMELHSKAQQAEIERLTRELRSIAEYDCPGNAIKCPGCAACDARKALSGEHPAPEPKVEFNPDTIPECPRCQVQHWPQCPDLDLWTCDKCAGPPRPYEFVDCILGGCKPVRCLPEKSKGDV